MRVGSLFSGIGGWEFALGRNAVPSFAVEMDPDVAAAFAINHGIMPHVDDLRNVDARRLPGIDLLVASPPCPATSKARKASSLRWADSLAGLEILRFVRALQPWAVAIENSDLYIETAVCAQIVKELREERYNVEATVLDAADYGTPQRRHRTIIRAVDRTVALPPLPPERRGRSWSAALVDILPVLPVDPGGLVPWQRRNIDAIPPTRYPVLVTGGNPPEYANEDGYRRVWVDRDEPAPTLSKHQAIGGTRIMLSPTDIRKVTVAAFAVLSGFDKQVRENTLDLPEGRSRALDILGNMIPPPLAAAALKGLFT